MKEITILTQAEFDALQSPKELTLIYVKGELQKINREIENTTIHVSGSAKIDYVSGSAKIYSVSGNAKIDSVYGSAKIYSVSGNAKIDSVSGNAKIDYVYGSAKIDSVSGNAKINSVSDSAKIDYVSGSAKIDSVSGNAKINSVSDSAKIDSVYGSAKIYSVSGNAKIDSVSGNAKIDYVYGSAKIDSVSGNAKIDSVYGYGSANIHNDCCPVLHGFSVIWAFNDLCKPIQKSSNSVILRPNSDPLETYFNANPIDISNETVLLYKRVSKDFQTQEGTKNETIWKVGTKIIHPDWKPEGAECGEGKFHACCKPVFCDQFRSNEGDKYICVEVKKEDLFAWENPNYPRKIAFKAGFVLYECDRDGNKI